MTRFQGRELVALQVPQGPGFVRSLRALWDEGAAVLPLAPDLPEPELQAVVDHVRPAALVHPHGRRSLGAGEPVAPAVDVVVLTSGSTGRAKGVELSRSALAAAARMTTMALGCHPGDRWLCPVPVTRIAGLSILARSELLGTEPLILDRFEVDAVARAEDCRYVSLVPTMLHRLLEAKIDLTHFEAILLGGAAPDSGLVERARAVGARIVRTYGMTETCGGVVYDGRPLAGVDVKVDHDGIVHLRTSSVMERYRRDDDLTHRALVDGWYRTGDIGVWDGETLRVLGREDDAIVTGGEKVFPREVEQALLAHPRVIAARVSGESDEEWGQRVVATVTTDADEEALRGFLKERLARHKIPSRIVREGSR